MLSSASRSVVVGERLGPWRHHEPLLIPDENKFFETADVAEWLDQRFK